jgi:hypothetical protein
MDQDNDSNFEAMRNYILIAEALDGLLTPAPQPEPIVEDTRATEDVPSPLVFELMEAVTHMRALMENSGDAAYDEGFDAASARWADVIENIVRRNTDLKKPEAPRRYAVMERAEENSLFEMAGLRSSQTGLPFYVWASPKGGAKHDVRIKVSPSFKYDPENEVVLGLRPTIRVLHGDISAKDLRLVTEWAEKNMDAIVAFWNEEIDQDDFKDRIQPI